MPRRRTPYPKLTVTAMRVSARSGCAITAYNDTLDSPFRTRILSKARNAYDLCHQAGTGHHQRPDIGTRRVGSREAGRTPDPGGDRPAIYRVRRMADPGANRDALISGDSLLNCGEPCGEPSILSPGRSARNAFVGASNRN